MAEFHLSIFNVFQRKSTSALTQHMPIHSISELSLKVNDPDATGATVWPGEATSRDVTKGPGVPSNAELPKGAKFEIKVSQRCCW